MTFRRPTQFVLATVVFAALALTAACSSCSSKPPSRFDKAQQESTQPKDKQAPVNQNPIAGGTFNKFFPKAEAGYTVTFAQEKKGVSQASLKKDGKEVALLSVTDTTANPTSLDKYKASTTKIGGHPSVQFGPNTSVLVKGRYQVTVAAKPGFAKPDAEKWLQKFDLAGIASIP